MTSLTTALVADRLDAVRSRVARAAERASRDPSSVQLLAVTKGHPIGAVTIATQLGLHDVGESRVQEAQTKRAAYTGEPVSWHMVGHLQRNKARVAASLFDTVHSVDSGALASSLARHRADSAARLRVFVEVDLSGIPGRSGVSPEGAPDLVTEVWGLPELELEGLMTIAPPGPAEVAAACFARLSGLRGSIAENHGLTMPGLSMGMSGDFEVAIAHGATVIRLGRVLFGDLTGDGT